MSVKSKFNFNNINTICNQLPKQIKEAKISVLLPYYNEQNIIVNNVLYIYHKLKEWNFNFEIIVSDDGSQDQGFFLLKKEFEAIDNIILIRSSRNYGKGRALSTAFEQSSGEYILFLDSDLELPIEHLPYFLLTMYEKNVDIVIGSKEDCLSDIHYPLIRKIFSRCYALINRILFNLSVPDTQTGIKLFKRNVLECTLPYLLVKKFAFDIELLALCTNNNFSMTGHPIVLEYTRENVIGRMSLDTILHMFKDTLAVFWRLKINFYNQIKKGKKAHRYGIISFDINDQSKKDCLYIKDVSDINSIISYIKQYDIVIFKDQGMEIPVFAYDILDRIFSDESIDLILPLELPMTNLMQEELFYSIFGNIFFPWGFYPQYRPVFQNIISSKTVQQLNITSFVYRRNILENMITTLNNNSYKLPDTVQVFHTPFYYVHKQFPTDINEFTKYLNTVPKNFIGIKKNVFIFYLCCVFLFFIGMITRLFYLLFPLLLLEVIMNGWYIYALGIRKGLKYIYLLTKIRITSIINLIKKS